MKASPAQLYLMIKQYERWIDRLTLLLVDTKRAYEDAVEEAAKQVAKNRKKAKLKGAKR